MQQEKRERIEHMKSKIREHEDALRSYEKADQYKNMVQMNAIGEAAIAGAVISLRTKLEAMRKLLFDLENEPTIIKHKITQFTYNHLAEMNTIGQRMRYLREYISSHYNRKITTTELDELFGVREGMISSHEANRQRHYGVVMYAYARLFGFPVEALFNEFYIPGQSRLFSIQFDDSRLRNFEKLNDEQFREEEEWAAR